MRSLAFFLLISCGSGTPGGTPPNGRSPAQPHTPATGCHEGFTACGTVCADLATDGRHCGACQNACGFDEGCVGGSCVTGGNGCGPALALCDETCVRPRTDAAHCGSCGNRCADDGLCVDGACVDAGGDGSSCERPLFWNFDAEEEAGFFFSPALTELHTFECGPLDPIPTRWFRLTATKDDTDIEIRRAEADDYIIEVFGENGCPVSSRLACNDDANGLLPEVSNVPTTAGRTYWIAVGLKSTWSGASASIRGDH